MREAGDEGLVSEADYVCSTLLELELVDPTLGGLDMGTGKAAQPKQVEADSIEHSEGLVDRLCIERTGPIGVDQRFVGGGIPSMARAVLRGGGQQGDSFGMNRPAGCGSS